MKKVLLFVAGAGVLACISGCRKQESAQAEVVPQNEEVKKQDVDTIFTAFNARHYEHAQHAIGKFIENYPEDTHIPSFKLMVADMKYELGQFEQAYEGYRHFQEYYPANEQAEYAAYKAAHAKFNLANHVNCDTAPIDATIALCRDYTSRSDYKQFRNQMEDLQRTCQRHLLDKELYVLNTYINQSRLASARHRLDLIKQNFNLEGGGAHDKLLFYQAKLAKCENNSDELQQMVSDLTELYPRSQFTAMASRL